MSEQQEMTEKEIDIEKVMFHESNVLIDNYRMQIVDAELDPIQCKFNGDGCVEIDTEKVTYITLTRQNLQMLIDTIEEVETTLYQD